MKLIILEPDRRAEWLAARLSFQGFNSHIAQSLDEAVSLHEQAACVALIADSSALGPSNPAQAVKRLRNCGFDAPLVLLVDALDWRNAVACFDAGADDIVARPGNAELIAARLRAILRRIAREATNCLAHGSLKLDLKAQRASKDAVALSLTRNEFRLLRLLLLEPDRVHSQCDLVRRLGLDTASASHNALEVLVARLRRKIGHEMIRTIRGLGYCIAPPEDHDRDGGSVSEAA